ncbi:MAG TPA: AbrB family transcriptional regulator [bacterium]
MTEQAVPLPKPSRRPPPRTVGMWLGTLALGGVGGALFAWLHMPLAWMLGAMAFTMVPALRGWKLSQPRGLRGTMLVVLGVLIGAAFTPDILHSVGRWSVSIVVMVLFVAISTVLTQMYLSRVAGLDGVTAYFSSAPGGLAAMAVLGGAMGGDEREISLIHTVRVVMTTVLIPLGVRVAEGALSLPAPPPPAPLHGMDALILLGTGIVGYLLAGPLRLPAPQLIGPMLASVAVHMAGFSESRPPYVLVALAQVVLGCSVGCRFVGVPLKRIMRALSISFGSSAVLLVAVIAIAFGIHVLLGQDMAAAVLAYAPGGIPEMTLMAIAMHIDVAYVAVHHLVRVLLIMAFAPLIFRMFPEWFKAAPAAPPPDNAS